jgi:HK97 family phage portal protein
MGVTITKDPEALRARWSLRRLFSRNAEAPSTALVRTKPSRGWLARMNPFRRRPRIASRDVEPTQRTAKLALRSSDSLLSQLFTSLSDDGFMPLQLGGRTVPAVTVLTATIWTYACASLIARSMGSIPLRVLLDGEPAPDDDPLVVLLARPAPNWSQARFLQASAYYSKLTGSAFWRLERARSRGASQLHSGRGLPAELWPYGDDSYSTTVQTTGRPLVTKYTDKDGKSVEPEDVIQVIEVKPGAGNEGEGLAVSVAAGGEIVTEQAASTWQRKSLENRAVPAGILQLLEDTTDEQFDEVEARLTDTYQGALNAGKPMILGNEVKWLQLARTVVEMDLINGRKLTREGICAAFGVPPILVGILDRATYSNFDASELAFWKLTILPLMGSYIDSLNTELAPEFGDAYVIEADLSRVDALMPMLDKRIDSAKKLWTMGVPMSHLNEMFALGVAEYPGWDVGLVASNLVPIASLGDSTDDTP